MQWPNDRARAFATRMTRFTIIINHCRTRSRSFKARSHRPTRLNSTQQNCFVALSLQSDHIARPDSTQQNSFVELSRVGRCDRAFRQLSFRYYLLYGQLTLHYK